jgi:hypothetical protein
MALVSSETYLEQRFGTHSQQLASWLSNPVYQTAYRHCLIERQVTAIFQAVGILFEGSRITPATIQHDGCTVTVHPDQVVTWLGLVPATVNSIRTQFKKTRDAHHLLRQQQFREHEGHPGPNPLQPRHLNLLSTLNIMLAPRVISVGNNEYLQGGQEEGVYNALTKKIGLFMKEIQEVLETWSL